MVPDVSSLADQRVTVPSSIPEQIARYLRESIFEGRHSPGAQLKEQALAELFAVSRGPVRDALHMLEKEGLVEIQPRRGAFVTTLKLNDVIDNFNIRGVLLSLVVRYLACNPDKSALSNLEPLLQSMRQLARQQEPAGRDFVKAIRRISMALLDASDSKRLMHTYRSLSHDALWPLLWGGAQPPDFMTVRRRLECVHDHEQVIKAIFAGDAPGAEAAIRDITRKSRDEVVARLHALRAEEVDAFRMRAL